MGAAVVCGHAVADFLSTAVLFRNGASLSHASLFLSDDRRRLSLPIARSAVRFVGVDHLESYARCMGGGFDGVSDADRAFIRALLLRHFGGVDTASGIVHTVACVCVP